MKSLLSTFILLVSFSTLPKAQSTSSADLFLSLLGTGSEEAIKNSLVSESGETLDRLPYHRAFSFGRVAAYPETGLVK